MLLARAQSLSHFGRRSQHLAATFVYVAARQSAVFCLPSTRVEKRGNVASVSRSQSNICCWRCCASRRCCQSSVVSESVCVRACCVLVSLYLGGLRNSRVCFLSFSPKQFPELAPKDRQSDRLLGIWQSIVCLADFLPTRIQLLASN